MCAGRERGRGRGVQTKLTTSAHLKGYPVFMKGGISSNFNYEAILAEITTKLSIKPPFASELHQLGMDIPQIMEGMRT
jgi:hypothetical protein